MRENYIIKVISTFQSTKISDLQNPQVNWGSTQSTAKSLDSLVMWQVNSVTAGQLLLHRWAAALTTIPDGFWKHFAPAIP